MPLFTDTETARINRLILMGGNTGMTELQFFAAEIDEWKRSRKRKEQITGDAYYEGLHDILTRKRTIIGEDGKLQEVDNLPNNQAGGQPVCPDGGSENQLSCGQALFPDL